MPFAVAVPPGWRLAAYTDSGEMDTNPNCAHVVDFFPPNESVKQEDIPTSPELIRLFIRIQCPSWDPSQDTRAQPMTGTYMLGPAKATMYQSDVAGVAVQRSDVATLGGHQYTFLLQYTYGPSTPESGAQQALTIYRQMVSSFTYQ